MGTNGLRRNLRKAYIQWSRVRTEYLNFPVVDRRLISLDTSYCPAGIFWPGIDDIDTINRIALERGYDRDGRCAWLYDSSQFYNARKVWVEVKGKKRGAWRGGCDSVPNSIDWVRHWPEFDLMPCFLRGSAPPVPRSGHPMPADDPPRKRSPWL